ncbi:unnamed protein product [Zymoseptoria tritici ST99CH_3D7]|uniref:F-box domain-containing protein n=1 Tax=Zymoseptoria tritici (strain ST99CH_3D7) TaxID=1276538 RepID=A0A1X7S4P1_ZYMT9|nr:unnamed protein product [Zymoseptoria tritici ST99CH_3D7]
MGLGLRDGSGCSEIGECAMCVIGIGGKAQRRSQHRGMNYSHPSPSLSGKHSPPSLASSDGSLQRSKSAPERVSAWLRRLHQSSSPLRPVHNIHHHRSHLGFKESDALSVVDEDPPLTIQTSAATRLLNTFTVCVNILLLLPIEDLLACRRVSGTFKDTIEHSEELREKLFLEPNRRNAPREERRPAVIPNPTPPPQVALRIGNGGESVEGVVFACHPRASWNQRQGTMFLTQPPARRIEIASPLSRAEHNSRHRQVYREDGVRFGDLIAEVKRMPTWGLQSCAITSRRRSVKGFVAKEIVATFRSVPEMRGRGYPDGSTGSHGSSSLDDAGKEGAVGA